VYNVAGKGGIRFKPPILSYLVKKVGIDLRIGKFKVSKKAVSPVIATLLMIAVAVAASVIVYVWSAGLLGTLMGGGGAQVKEQLTVESYNWTTPNPDIYVRNVGSSAITVASIYLAGANCSFTATTYTIGVGSSAKITITAPAGCTAGTAYALKIATKSGAIFAVSIIKGYAG